MGESRLAVLVELLFNRARKQNQIGASMPTMYHIIGMVANIAYDCLFKHRFAFFKKRRHGFLGMRTAQKLPKGLNLNVNRVAQGLLVVHAQ